MKSALGQSKADRKAIPRFADTPLPTKLNGALALPFYIERPANV